MINTKQLLLIAGLFVSSISLMCSEAPTQKELALRNVRQVLGNKTFTYFPFQFDPKVVDFVLKKLEDLPDDTYYENVTHESFRFLLKELDYWNHPPMKWAPWVITKDDRPSVSVCCLYAYAIGKIAGRYLNYYDEKVGRYVHKRDLQNDTVQRAEELSPD